MATIIPLTDARGATNAAARRAAYDAFVREAAVGPEPPAAYEPILKGFSFDELHREIVLAIGLAGFVDGDDVGMVEARREPGLLFEAADVVAFAAAVVVEDLERDFGYHLL